MRDVQELIALYPLGLLDEDEEKLLLAAAKDPAVAAELHAHQKLVETLPEPMAPSPHVRDRLIASIGGGRYDRFAERFAAIFDVTAQRARELLAWIEDPTKWEAFRPGVRLVHFPAGPACAGADNGLVWVEPGARFPWHHHDGEEYVLVLGGAATEDDGTVVRVGEEFTLPANSAHDFVALPGEPFVYAVRVFGVDFDVEKPTTSR